MAIFKVDFRYENRYINRNNTHHEKLEKEREAAESKPELLTDALGQSFKKLRNELAKAVHPDKHGGCEEMQQEFKQIQEAFEEGNVSKLIETADRLMVDVQLEDSDLLQIEKIMKKQSRYIKSVESGLEWAWMMCDRNNADRSEVWKVLRIDKIDFKNWFRDLGGNLDSLEKECIDRKNKERSIKRKKRPTKKSRAKARRALPLFN